MCRKSIFLITTYNARCTYVLNSKNQYKFIVHYNYLNFLMLTLNVFYTFGFECSRAESTVVPAFKSNLNRPVYAPEKRNTGGRFLFFLLRRIDALLPSTAVKHYYYVVKSVGRNVCEAFRLRSSRARF